MIYLMSVLIFALVWLVLFIRHPALRACSLISGLLFLPAGLTQALFVPDYWDPKVIFKIGGRFDLESLLFAFFTGGIASILYPACFNLRPYAVPGSKSALVKYLFWIFPALGALLLIVASANIRMEKSLIYIAFAVLAFGVMHMFAVRPDLIITGMWGALLFCGMYSMIAIGIVWIFPDFISTTWKGSRLFKYHVLGIPLEEYLYSALFGALWSTVYCGLFDCRFVSNRPPAEG